MEVGFLKSSEGTSHNSFHVVEGFGITIGMCEGVTVREVHGSPDA